jgi:tRNA dimethylallyltransferase
LYKAINARFDVMLRDGAVDEVRAFAARRLDPALPAMKAHGAPALMAHLEGDMPLDVAAEIGKRDTRRYAKRQFTWIANQMRDWPRVSASDLEERMTSALAVLNAPR